MALAKSLQSLIHRLQKMLHEEVPREHAARRHSDADPAVPAEHDEPAEADAGEWENPSEMLAAMAAERTVEGRLEAKLVKALRRRESMVTGLVYLVSLERLLAYIRSRKPYMLDKAFQVAESVLRSHLAREDFFAKYRDTGFLVAFAHLTREAAQLKSAMLSRLIAEHLVGADAAPELAVTRQVAFEDDGAENAEPQLHFHEIPSIEGLGDMMLHAGAAVAAEVPLPPEDEPAEGVEERRPRRREPAWTYDAPGPDFHERVLFRLGFAYLPVWGAQTRQVTNYIWRHCLTGDDAGKGDYDVLPHKGWAKEIRELDLYSLRVFRARMADIAAAPERLKCLLTLTLHYETLVSSKGRFQVVQLAQGLPPSLRRRIVFEIVGVPPGVVAGRLLEILGLLRPLGRSALLRLPPDFTALPEFNDPFLFALGTRIEEEEEADGLGYEQLARFAQWAHERGCKSYLLDVRDEAVAAEAVAMGYDYLAGDGIMAPVEEPAGIVRLDLRGATRQGGHAG